MNGIVSLLFLNSQILLSVDPNAVSGVRTSLELFSQIIICIVGIGGIVAFFFKGKFKTWKAITMMARTVNAFMEKVIPDLLQGFETKGFLPKQSLVDWTKALSSEYYAEARSPLKLNEDGERLLRESGIKKIIDAQLDALIKELEQKHPKSLLDVEDQAFYVLKGKEDEQATIRLRNFLYNNPEETMNDILFVGSIYFRDKFLEKHQELLSLDNQEDAPQNKENNP